MPDLTFSDPFVVAVILLAALAAGLVRGFSGFGGPALLILVLVHFFNPLSVLTKVLMIDVVASIKMLPSTYKDVAWRVVIPLLLGSLIGFPLGTWVLLELEPEIMKRAIAAVVAVCTALLLTGWRFHREPGLPFCLFFGVIAGFIIGSTFIALVTATFLLAGPWAAPAVRASMVYWACIMNALLLGTHSLAGSIVVVDLWRAAVIGVVYVIGTMLGSHLFLRVADRDFRKLVLALLLALSVLGLLG